MSEGVLTWTIPGENLETSALSKSNLSIPRTRKPYELIFNSWNTARQQAGLSKVATLPYDMSDQDISYEPYTDHDEALNTITALADENERLNDRLAIEALDATKEEKNKAAETISTVRAELNLMTVERDNLKASRNTYQNENAELKMQCSKYLAVIKKLNEQLEKREAELEFYRAVGGAGSKDSKGENHPVPPTAI